MIGKDMRRASAALSLEGAGQGREEAALYVNQRFAIRA